MTPLAERPIAEVAIIGAGVAGRGFAARCVRSGFSVILEDVLPSKLRLADQMEASLPGQLRFATTVEEAVRAADIAVDFVPDELESKLEIFCLIDRMAPPHTILCTPTMLSIADLASCTYRPERCVALRGNLSGDSPQLVRGQAASEATLQRTLAWLNSLGYAAECVDDAEEPMLVKNLPLHQP